MRIMAFCGHPITETLEQCEDLGKRLKRNNVAIDVINFSHKDNVPKLEALIATSNNSGNSNFVDVPHGVGFIADVLLGSSIFSDGESGAAPNN